MNDVGVWRKSEAKNFELEVEKPISATGKMVLRYVEGYQFDNAMVKISYVSPSKQLNEATYQIKVKDQNGDYLGEPALEMWDVEYEIPNKFALTEAGTYQFKLEHVMPVDNLPFVLEVGFVLKKI